MFIQINKKPKMKAQVGLVILAASVIGVTACSTGDKSVAKEEVKEAVGQVPEDYKERRADFLEKTEDKLADIRKDLSSFESARAKSASEETAKDALEETRDKLDDVEENFSDLKDADASDFEEDRQEFMAEMNELEAQYTQVRSYYR